MNKAMRYRFKIFSWLGIVVLCIASSNAYADKASQEKLDGSLMSQCGYGNAEEVAELLKQGANPNATNKYGHSPLRQASRKGSLKVMQLLIDNGADVHAKPKDGRSMIAEAASSWEPKAVAMLLKSGAKPDAEALKIASGLGRGETAQLLLKAGVDPNAGLASAAQGGRVELVKRLLIEGAKVDGIRKGISTPLHLAALQGGAEMVKLLLANQADPNCFNERNEVPLHMAISGDSDIRVVKLLVQSGAKLDVANDEGITPVRLAAIRGAKPIYDWLVATNGGKEPKARIVQSRTTDETTAELIQVLLSKKKREERIAAQRKLVARGSEIMPEVLASIQADTPIHHFFELFAALGPEAETALPKITELLTDKRYVAVSRLFIDRIEPGHFAQLPVSVREQSDAALYQALLDPELRKTAGYFRNWLSEESQLKLLRSQQAEHRALGVRIRRKIAQLPPEIEIELVKILRSKDELFSTRKKAARVLGDFEKLREETKAALLEILKSAPPYDQNVSEAERRKRQETRGLSKEVGRALAAAGPTIIDDLLLMLTPINNPHRSGAMETLRHLGPSGIPRLIELLAHENEDVRISTSVALNRIGKPSVPALIKALDSKKKYVLEGALSALRWIGPGAKDAIPAIRAIIVAKKQPDRIIIAACDVALKIDPQNSQIIKDVSKLLPTLIRTFEGGRAKSHLGATEVLRKLGSDAEEALPALQKYLKRQSIDNEGKYSIDSVKAEVKEVIKEIERASSLK